MSVAQWLSWLGATLAAAVTASAFAFTHFESQSGAKEKRDEIVRRLERIEDKLDKLRR